MRTNCKSTSPDWCYDYESLISLTALDRSISADPALKCIKGLPDKFANIANVLYMILRNLILEQQKSFLVFEH
jgi:hypothetical protein